jgi:hypothetical protein
LSYCYVNEFQPFILYYCALYIFIVFSVVDLYAGNFISCETDYDNCRPFALVLYDVEMHIFCIMTELAVEIEFILLLYITRFALTVLIRKFRQYNQAMVTWSAAMHSNIQSA